MSFGQFSAHTARRTKQDMLDAADPRDSRGNVMGNGYAPVIWSRKAGNNRLHYKTADGCEHFMLHATTVASVNAERTRITFRDGGWPSMTTRKAWGDVVTAFYASCGSGGTRLSAHGDKGRNVINGYTFDREATFTWPGLIPIAEAKPAEYMLRATVDGQSIEIRWDGHDVWSGLDPLFPCNRPRLVKLLAEMSSLATQGRRWCGSNYDPVNYSIEMAAGPYTINPGRFGRSLHVGCHEFKTQDVRALLRRLKSEDRTARVLPVAVVRKVVAIEAGEG